MGEETPLDYESLVVEAVKGIRHILLGGGGSDCAEIVPVLVGFATGGFVELGKLLVLLFIEGRVGCVLRLTEGDGYGEEVIVEFRQYRHEVGLGELR